MRSKGVIIMTSDLAHIVPHSRPNIPPLEYISDGIFLGTSEFLKMPVCLSFQKLLAPTGIIIGKIRTGKSTTAKSLLIRQHLQYGTNVLIFDPHGEYGDLVRGLGGIVIDMREQKINPCHLGKGLSVTQKAYQLVDMLETVFELNQVQRSHLIDYAKRGYEECGDELTFDYVIEMLKQDSRRNSMLAKTLHAILVRIGILSESIFGDTNSIPIDHITGGLVCLDLSKLENNNLRNLAMLSVLQYIYNNMLASQSHLSQNSENIRLIIMIDEAGRIASHESSVAVKLVKESGKFKIGLFFGIQDLPDIDSRIMSNYGFLIVHKLDNSEYISQIKKDGHFTTGQAERIHSLPVGTAYLKLNFKDASVSRPFIVRIVQEELGEYGIKPKAQTAAFWAKKDQISAIRPQLPKIRKNGKSPKLDNLGKQKLLFELGRRLAKSIAENPSFNVTQHYKNIGTDTYHGNKARDILESKGYIKGTYLKGKGRILHITEKGTEEIGIQKNTNRFGSGLHINLIDNIVTMLQNLDHNVVKEKQIGDNKFTDIVVDSKFAIEVETREIRRPNVYKNLDAGYQLIIVCYKKSHLDNFQKKIEQMQLTDEQRKKVTVIDYNTFCKPEKLRELFGDTPNDK